MNSETAPNYVASLELLAPCDLDIIAIVNRSMGYSFDVPHSPYMLCTDVSHRGHDIGLFLYSTPVQSRLCE